MKPELNLVGDKNIAAILNVVRQERRVSRADIARATRLTPATVSSLIARAVEAGIVRTVGLGQSRGGRRPLLVEFDPKAFYLAGIDIGLRKAILLIVDPRGEVVARSRIEVPPDTPRDECIAAVLSATRRLFEGLGAGRDKILGIGLSISGLIDSDRGIAIRAPNMPGWRDTPIVEIFQSELGVYCFLENDARAMALGEVRFGSGRGCKNLFSAIIGRGIGGGVIINGELFSGNGDTAGEFGHITVNHTGPACNCGNRGCLEVMASGTAIAASAVRVVTSGAETVISELVDGRVELVTAEIVAKAARMGDAVADRLMREAAEYIGIGLATVVNLLGPELIVIGGGVSESGESFLENIRSTVASRAFCYQSGLAHPEFALASLGAEGSAIGAAALVLDRWMGRTEGSRPAIA